MHKKLDVAAIIGVSYCGSTLLNYILDSHPEIYGGGELHVLLRQGKRPRCKICGEQCVYWTPENLERPGAEPFYTAIAEIFSTRIIADSSKNVFWFRERMAAPGGSEVRLHPVLMVKHPIRLLASFLINQTLRGRDGDPLKEEYCRLWIDGSGDQEQKPASAEMEALRRRLLEKYLQIIISFYSNTMREMNEAFADSSAHVVRYEDLVRSAEQALDLLLKALGLKFHPQMQDCYSVVHHDIGGNSGTSYQYHRKDEQTFAQYHPARRDFYKNMKGIRMDNKYRNVLRREDYDWLLRSPQLLELCRFFGYSAMPGEDE